MIAGRAWCSASPPDQMCSSKPASMHHKKSASAHAIGCLAYGYQMMIETVIQAMRLRSHLLGSVDIVHCMLMLDMASSLIRHPVARAGCVCSEILRVGMA